MYALRRTRQFAFYFVLAASLVPSSSRPYDGERHGVVQHYRVPDVTLVDMNNKPFSLRKELEDPTPIILQFFYTTCAGICPISSAIFGLAQSELDSKGVRARFWSISLDPEVDAPDILRAYAEAHDAGPAWTFLTGKLDDVIEVQRAFEAYRSTKANHEPLTFVRLRGGDWVRFDGIVKPAVLLSEIMRASE